jgi:hypothetical protein
MLNALKDESIAEKQSKACSIPPISRFASFVKPPVGIPWEQTRCAFSRRPIHRAVFDQLAIHDV